MIYLFAAYNDTIFSSFFPLYDHHRSRSYSSSDSDDYSSDSSDHKKRKKHKKKSSTSKKSKKKSSKKKKKSSSKDKGKDDDASKVKKMQLEYGSKGVLREAGAITLISLLFCYILSYSYPRWRLALSCYKVQSRSLSLFFYSLIT